jgi:hypothetical protein
MEDVLVLVADTIPSRVGNVISPVFQPPNVVVEDISLKEPLLLKPLAVPS